MGQEKISLEKKALGVPPNIKGSNMQIRMCVFGDEVSEKVIVRFARNQYSPLVEMEEGYRWWGRGVDVGRIPGKLVRPFIPCEPRPRPYVGKKRGALPGSQCLSYFPKYVRVRM